MSGPRADARPCIGISACLLGEAVRYDGGHKREDALVDRLGPHVRWLPTCPEVEAGFGVPRPPVRLEGEPGAVRVVGVRTRQDLSTQLEEACRALTGGLERAGVSGFVLKSRSPSCGLGDTPLHNRAGREFAVRDGVFTEALRRAAPEMPIAVEDALRRPAERESFLAAVEAYAAFAPVRAGDVPLASFHRRHRLQVELRRPETMVALRALRDVGDAARYAPYFFHALEAVPSRADHHRVLLKAADLVIRAGPSRARRDAGAPVDAYANGAATLREAVEELAGAVERYAVVALLQDAYLHPGPPRLREYELL